MLTENILISRPNSTLREISSRIQSSIQCNVHSKVAYVEGHALYSRHSVSTVIMTRKCSKYGEITLFRMMDTQDT